MVTQSAAQISNARIATSLPAGMVAVFVGGTSGIGEHALKNFAQHAKSPKIYLIGRSKDASNRIISECAELNPDGEYIFMQADISLLQNVCDVCDKILAREDSINLLFQTQGGLRLDKTSEGLSLMYVLPFASRILFTVSLLPALQNASGLKRVVSIFAAGFEGYFDDKNWAEYPYTAPAKARAHLASMITMAHNVLARKAPDVSFIHNFPGAVKTEFGRDAKGAKMVMARIMFHMLGTFVYKYRSVEESSVLQLYGATSAAFPPTTGSAVGVPLSENVSVSVGADGKKGSGSYNLDADYKTVSHSVETHLAQARANGVEERLWIHVLAEIKQVTGRVF